MYFLEIKVFLSPHIPIQCLDPDGGGEPWLGLLANIYPYPSVANNQIKSTITLWSNEWQERNFTTMCRYIVDLSSKEREGGEVAGVQLILQLDEGSLKLIETETGRRLTA